MAACVSMLLKSRASLTCFRTCFFYFFFVVVSTSLHYILKNYTTKCTYSLTPRCRLLLEQLTGLQLVKKFPVFHGPRRFIIALTSVRHLSLSWASPIQSTHPHPTSCRSILILSTHLRLGLPSGSRREIKNTKVTSSWFFLSTLNYDARSATRQKN